jgi:hypothetical protein
LPLYTIQALGFDPIGAGLVACSQAGGAVSRLVLGAASDRWLADRRAVWLGLTGGIGACSFAAYAVCLGAARRGSAGVRDGNRRLRLGADLLRDQRGAGRFANGRVAERNGVRFDRDRAAGGPPATFGLLLVRWDSYAAPWAAFAALSAVAACATLVISSASERERR